MTEIGGFDYLFIRCLECEARQISSLATAKIAKHKGADNWSIMDESFREFLLLHGGCDPKTVKIEWVKE